MMFDREKVRQDAEQLRAGERVVMKRWLCRHKIFFDDVYCLDTEYIVALVDKHGGNSEALKQEGSGIVINEMCKARGL